MSRNGKIVLGVVVGLLALCMCTAVGVVALGGALFSSAVSVSPERVQSVAIAVAGLELPGQYTAEWSVDFMGVKAAGFQAGRNHVIIAALPAYMEVDVDEVQRQLRRAVGDRENYHWYSNEMHVVGKQTVQIAGQSVEVVMAEGEGSYGAYRQASGLYDGRNGKTFFTVAGPVATWNQAEVDEIIRSFR